MSGLFRSSAASGAFEPQPRHPTVLVIGDDPGITDTFVRMLTLEGHDVHSAPDASSGLDMADILVPDVILVDLRMPCMDGLEFLRRLRVRSRHRDTPVAIITGDYFIDDALIDELSTLGARLYFKPVWCGDLVRIAEELLFTAGEAQSRPEGVVNPASDLTDRPTLLLVDDCIAQRDLYEMALQVQFKVLTASRGDEGLEVASREHPDLIVLDVMMPGLNGWETCTRLKSHKETADIPIVFLTSRDDQDLSQHAKAVGGSLLLRKPCTADRLLISIRSTLGVSTQRRTVTQRFHH